MEFSHMKMIGQTPIRFFRQTRIVDDTKIDCKVCNPFSPTLSHNTRVFDAERIAEDGLKPSPLTFDSLSASFSAYEKQTRVGGLIKMVFDREILEREANMIPMCYVESRTRENEKYDKILDEYMEGTGFGSNKISSLLGLMTDRYEDECEWLSREPIGVDVIKKALKKIVFEVPWKVWTTNRSCYTSFPHYISLTKAQLTQTLPKFIKHGRDAAEKLGVPFVVDSCFKYVRVNGLSGKWYKLDDENLGRLERGEELEPLEKSLDYEDFYEARGYDEKYCRC